MPKGVDLKLTKSRERSTVEKWKDMNLSKTDGANERYPPSPFALLCLDGSQSSGYAADAAIYRVPAILSLAFKSKCLLCQGVRCG